MNVQPSRLRAQAVRFGVKPQEHRPAFHAEDLEEFIAISDGDLPVALFHRPWFGLQMREFYPDGRNRPTFHIRRPFHNPCNIGAKITGCWWIGAQQPTSSAQDIQISGGGERLTLRVNEVFGPDEAGHHTLTFYFDRELGCYGVDCHAALALHRPKEVEIVNFHYGSLGVANPELNQMQHTLWSNVRNGLSYFFQNPLVPNTPGNMGVGDGRRIPVGGFITFGTQPLANPVLELLGSHTEALGSGTCSAFYDEHIGAGCPTPIDATGKYRWEHRYRLVSIPPELADALLAQAKLVDFKLDDNPCESWEYLNVIRSAGRNVQPLDQALPFALWTVNGFEEALDPRRRFVGDYWDFAPQPYGAIAWDRTCGFRSRSSLKLTGRTAQADITADLAGPPIRILPEQAHRASAMLKTRLAPGGQAWLELLPFMWGPADAPQVYRSTPLTDTNDWTALDVHLPCQPEQDHLCLRLRLQGEGEAWFDDVGLFKQSPAGA